MNKLVRKLTAVVSAAEAMKEQAASAQTSPQPAALLPQPAALWVQA